MTKMTYGKLIVLTTLLLSAQSVICNKSKSLDNKINEMPKECSSNTGAPLYPIATETRDLKTLDGIWNFRVSPSDPKYGQKNRWYKQSLQKTGPVIPMPVPSSYNDVGVDASIRDHVGIVWYDRKFHVPAHWGTGGYRVWLRFCSVHYRAQVYVNGKKVMFHEIGHLPFEAQITDFLHYNNSNLLTVAVDNRLFQDTIPQGNVSDSNLFDFFNYAGIHRTVFLYTTPRVYIDDVIVNTDIEGLTGLVTYNVTFKGQENVQCLVQIFDANEDLVRQSQACAGLLKIRNATFWWPYLMHPQPGYLYTLKTSIVGPLGEIIDTYNLKIGIRTITWSNTSMYINGKPLYLRGFGMHEDSDFRGKGWDPVLWVKNFNLIKWTGANVFRTSHYPYAEEIYQMADEQGIMIIDECPSANIVSFSDTLLKKHKQSLTELIRRDKNHPSVIMWSTGNEPGHIPKDERPKIRNYENLTHAQAYFAEIVRHVKSMDLSRPVTIVIVQSVADDRTSQLVDVICYNQYRGWYSEAGKLHNVMANVVKSATDRHCKYNKPIISTEYGADAIAGLHGFPEFTWSEEYQVALLSEHFKAFDRLRQANFFVGELIWNFADFKTPQNFRQVDGNKEGIFTRSRQPKASALHIRARYLALAAADTGNLPPEPMYYISDNKAAKHEEL